MPKADRQLQSYKFPTVLCCLIYIYVAASHDQAGPFLLRSTDSLTRYFDCKVIVALKYFDYVYPLMINWKWTWFVILGYCLVILAQIEVLFSGKATQGLYVSLLFIPFRLSLFLVVR